MAEKASPKKQGAITYEVGNCKPPKNRQFGQPEGNPRSGGHWKKEDTPRFKIQHMMNMNKASLREVIADEEAPAFEQKLAQCIIDDDWKTLEGMINQVYGRPTERIEHKIVDPKPILDLTKKK